MSTSEEHRGSSDRNGSIIMNNKENHVTPPFYIYVLNTIWDIMEINFEHVAFAHECKLLSVFFFAYDGINEAPFCVDLRAKLAFSKS